MKNWRTLIAVMVAMGFAVCGCGKSNDSSPSDVAAAPAAIIGVTNACLSRDRSLKSDGPPVELGSGVSVIDEAGTAIKIRLQDGMEYWTHRIYLCTPKELQARRNADQLPDAKRITFVGVAQDGQDTMYGYIPIEDGGVSLKVGQAMCFNQKYCAAHQGEKMDWMGLKGTHRADSLYLIKTPTSAVELPAWPRDRQREESSERSGETSTKPSHKAAAGSVEEEPVVPWLKFPPSGLIAFGLAGDFESPPTLTADSMKTKAWHSARSLVADEVFLVKHPRGNFNVWAGLISDEGSFRTNEIPHTRAHRDLTITPADLVLKYGEPSHVGSFKLKEGEKLGAYWFGPICVIAKDRNSVIMEIGGWPSRLVPRQVAGADDRVYTDKNRYFSFKPPEGWDKKEFEDPRSKVEFFLSMGVGQNRKASLFILAHPVATLSPDGQGTVNLRENSADRVSRLKTAGATDARFEVIRFCGVEASQIDATLPDGLVRMHAIWFIKFDRSYTISFITQPAFYQQYLPLIDQALATFQCTAPVGAEDVKDAARDKIQAEQIRVWVEGLKGPDLAEESERRLLEFGEAAIPALAKVQESGTPEQKRRAAKLIQAIRQGVEPQTQK